MGTRNVTAVLYGGVFKVAQYGQWDGYPSGQGATVLDFVKQMLADGKEQDFKQAVDRCFFLESADIDEVNKRFAADMQALDKATGYSLDLTSEERNKRKMEAYLAPGSTCYLSRDVGADILKVVMERPEARLGLQNNIEFCKDSSCEWAYIVNLDDRTIEVYNGYAETLPTEQQRFAGPDSKMGTYGPDEVQLLGSVSFDELPDDLSQFEPKDEDEAEAA
jgi:hypothetical protein